MAGLKKLVPALLLIAFGIFLGCVLLPLIPLNPEEREEKAIQDALQEAEYINPVIASNLGKHFIINFRPLRASLENIQRKYSQDTYIYFSYLNNASWIGLNERESFTAASTIKVPVAMSLLKAVEEGKLKLDERYTLSELDLNKGFGDLYKGGADQTFSVGELMEIMLEQSDNTALTALVTVFNHIGIIDPLEGTYGFLGWELTQEVPELGEEPNYEKINLKTLANIFIALYDAKYISVEHSNLILEHLAETPFDDRIAAGVPKNVPVSHKIGTAAGDNTYSDCGIIYAPNRHYLLCLGSAGTSEIVAAQFMAEVSKEVYDYVISN